MQRAKQPEEVKEKVTGKATLGLAPTALVCGKATTLRGPAPASSGLGAGTALHKEESHPSPIVPKWAREAEKNTPPVGNPQDA